jgi:hypothetical protein
MDLFSLIINLAAELAKLARTLLTDDMRFMALLARSRTALAAETYFSENNSPSSKNARSDRDASTRSRGLCWCCFHTVSHGKMRWRMSRQRPSSAGMVQDFACSGAGSHGQGGHGYRRNYAHSSVKWL